VDAVDAMDAVDALHGLVGALVALLKLCRWWGRSGRPSSQASVHGHNHTTIQAKTILGVRRSARLEPYVIPMLSLRTRVLHLFDAILLFYLLSPTPGTTSITVCNDSTPVVRPRTGLSHLNIPLPTAARKEEEAPSSPPPPQVPFFLSLTGTPSHHVIT